MFKLFFLFALVAAAYAAPLLVGAPVAYAAAPAVAYAAPAAVHTAIPTAVAGANPLAYTATYAHGVALLG